MRWMHSELERAKATEFFHEHGFVGFDSPFSAREIAELQNAAKQAEYADETLAITHDAIFAVPLFRDYARDERLARTAALLIRAPVELHNSRLNAKPMSGGTGGVVDWHQDYPFYPHTNFDCLAGVIHLDDEDEDSGPLRVLPGSHRQGPLSHSLNGEFVGRITENIEPDNAVTLTCKSGSVIFHHSLLVHYSGPKIRSGYRRHLIFGYRAQDAIQLGGTVWKSTGVEVMPRERVNCARFPDGTTVELRNDLRLDQLPRLG